MSYVCCLTTENKLKRKCNILELYLAAKMSSSMYCLCFVLLLTFEYICAYYFIDSGEEVTLKRLFNKKLLSKADRKFLSILKDLRDSIAHNCVDTSDYTFIRQVLNLLADIDLVSVFDVFEEDARNYKTLFKDSCMLLQSDTSFDVNKFLMQYYGANYSMLPKASVDDCKTLYDCLDLIKNLENVL